MPRHDYEQEHEHDGLRREPAPFNRDPTGSAWVVQASLRALPVGSWLNEDARVRASYELRSYCDSAFGGINRLRPHRVWGAGSDHPLRPCPAG